MRFTRFSRRLRRSAAGMSDGIRVARLSRMTKLLLLAVAALVAFSTVACSAPTEPTQQEGRQDYSVRVAAADAQKTADDISAHGVTLNDQVCYPRTYCSVSTPDADGFSTVLASLCCPGDACYLY